MREAGESKDGVRGIQMMNRKGERRMGNYFPEEESFTRVSHKGQATWYCGEEYQEGVTDKDIVTF